VILFITGTDTEVGKTYCGVALVRTLVRRGQRVAVMKPVACGFDTTPEGPRNADARALAAAANVPADYAEINPYCLALPASPHLAAAAEGVRIDLERLREGAARLQARSDVLIVEGAGGWFAPLDERHTMADLAATLDARVILVVGLRLGCLNHALLTAAALRASGLRFAGWIANHIDPAFAQAAANITTLEQRLAAPLLGRVAFDRGPPNSGHEVTITDASYCLDK
jgi:dethiobiotin synthetase